MTQQNNEPSNGSGIRKEDKPSAPLMAPNTAEIQSNPAPKKCLDCGLAYFDKLSHAGRCHGSPAPKDKGVKRYDLGQVVSIGTDKDFCKTEMVGVTEGKYVLYSDIEPVLKENEELQAHKDGTLDGDCQVCDYDSFHRLLKDKDAEIASQNRKIEWLQDQVKELEENLFKCQGFLLEADKKLAAYDSGMAQNNAVQHIAKESRY